MKLFATLAAAAVIFASCSGSGSEPATTPEIIGPTWQLVDGTVDGTPVSPPKSHPITVAFDGENLFGTASCNGYGGSYHLSGQVISVGGMSITEMACEPRSSMDAESLFMQGLSRVQLVEGQGQTLRLAGDGVDFEFEALESIADSELLGTVWVLDGLVQGDAVSSVSGERATLEFFSDGSFIGSTGCRTLVGDYQTSGSEIIVTSLSADGECPQDLMEQDSRVVTAFEGPIRIEISGDQMTTWVAGDEGLVYRADS